MEDTKVVLDQSVLLVKLRDANATISNLKVALAYEKSLRKSAEEELSELKKENKKLAAMIPKRRNKKAPPLEYSEFKSDGGRKATKAQPINSYYDFKTIANWFFEKGQFRNWAMWWVGIALGLRFSDLVALKWKNVLNENGEYRDRLRTYEHKTRKLQTCKITEAVRYALDTYREKCSIEIEPDKLLFPVSSAGRGSEDTPMTTSHGNKILKAAAIGCRVDFHLSTHTMRKSFINIAGCLDDGTIDTMAFTKLQGLLNHSSPVVTMQYMDKLNEMYDNARETVSDFLMGRRGNALKWGKAHSMDEMYAMLENISKKVGDVS